MKKSIDRTAEEILSLLRQDRKSFQAPGKLAYQLQINLNTLDSALAELKSWGYKIRVSKGKGIRLEGVPDLLTSLEIKEALKAKILGKEIYAYYSLKSTNDTAHTLAEAGAPEGTIVVAEEQTAGKGRLAREWFSPAGLGIWLSVILKPEIPLSSVPALSLCACLACVRTAERFTGNPPSIKWPNDSYLNHKKFSGVLTELSAELDRVNFVVLGLGININHSARDFPRFLRSKATSLRIVAKKKISRVEFLQTFLKEFEEIYQEYKRTGLKRFQAEIRRRFYLLNKPVMVQVGEKTICGTAVDLDSYGALILETKKGRQTITVFDVT